MTEFQSRLRGTFTLRDLVMEVEDAAEFTQESLYPIVYRFGDTIEKRDTGPTAGVYAGG